MTNLSSLVAAADRKARRFSPDWTKHDFADDQRIANHVS
jgi:hypothetical protein